MFQMQVLAPFFLYIPLRSHNDCEILGPSHMVSCEPTLGTTVLGDELGMLSTRFHCFTPNTLLFFLSLSQSDAVAFDGFLLFHMISKHLQDSSLKTQQVLDVFYQTQFIYWLNFPLSMLFIEPFCG